MDTSMTITEPTGARRAPPRLILVISSLQGGGAERQLSEMANYWVGGGADVTLATWSGPGIKDFYPLAPGVSRLWLDARVPRHMPFATLIASVRRGYKLRRVFRTLRPAAD